MLQIHDELVFEVAAANIDRLAKLVRDEMQSVMPLRVPLKVDVNRATTGPMRIACDQPFASDANRDSTLKTIGLVGGVASGKSLRRRDAGASWARAACLDADRPGHAVLAEDAEVHDAAAASAGATAFSTATAASTARRSPGACSPSGEAGAASASSSKNLLHPRIRQRLEADSGTACRDEGDRPSCSTPRCCWRPAGSRCATWC